MGADSRSGLDRAVRLHLMRGALDCGVPLDPEQLSAFEVYIETLLFWASRLSLTAAANAAEIVSSHILDSLPLARFVQTGWRVADLGSGAGFPGIPLAIARPDATVVLIESRRKRANFLRETVRRCAFENVEVLEERAEQVARERPAGFDLVVSRAVWGTTAFLGICRMLVRPAGLAIAMKGPKAATQAVPHEGFCEPELFRYALHGGVEHVLVTYRRC